jgi:hypothetical protein
MGRMNEADSGSKVRYSVQHIAPLAGGGQRPKVRYATENEAVEAARDMIGPNVTQVTIEASPVPHAPGTFSIRHFTLKEGERKDSGWRSWLDGEFVEDVHPAELRPTRWVAS